MQMNVALIENLILILLTYRRCQETLVSIVVETIPILSLSRLLPTLPSPFPWQFVSLMRSYWCLVLCVVEVISHCYMVDIVTCRLYHQIFSVKVGVIFSSHLLPYSDLFCVKCNLFIYCIYVFIYYYILSAGVATFIHTIEMQCV